MKRDEIERLRALAKATTGGGRSAWEARDDHDGTGWPVCWTGNYAEADNGVWCEPMHDPGGNAAADAAHIAQWSPAFVLALLDEIEKAQVPDLARDFRSEAFRAQNAPEIRGWICRACFTRHESQRLAEACAERHGGGR